MSSHERACKVGTPLESQGDMVMAFRTKSANRKSSASRKDIRLPSTPAALAASCIRLMQFPDKSHSQRPPLLSLHGWHSSGVHQFSRSSHFCNFFPAARSEIQTREKIHLSIAKYTKFTNRHALQCFSNGVKASA